MAEIYEDLDNTEEPSVPLAPQDTMAQGRIKLESQIKALQDSLNRRTQMPFDPTLMALATGLLKPTKTGSFGESLGYATEDAMGAAEKERTRKTDIEKMKLELALKQYELTGDAEGQRILSQVMAGATPPTTGAGKKEASPAAAGLPPVSGAAPVIEEGAQPQTQTMPTKEAVETIKANPNAMFNITMSPEIVASISRVSPKWGGVAQKIFDNQTKMAGVGQKEEELGLRRREVGTKSVPVVSPYDADREMKMSADQYDKYLKLDFSDNKSVNDWLRKNGLGVFAIGKEGTPVANAPAGQAEEGKTKSERELEKELTKETRLGQIKAVEAYGANLVSNSDQAVDLKPKAMIVRNMAENDDIKGAFGIIASKPGLVGSVLMFLKDPIAFGTTHVGISNIEGLVRQAGGSQAQINAAQALDTATAPIQLSLRQTYMKGTGPVSDMETRMVDKMTPLLTDTPTVIKFKSDFIIARSDFDTMNAVKFGKWAENNPSGTIAQYKRSPEYLGLVKGYNKQLMKINNQYFPNSPEKETSSPSKTTNKLPSLVDQLRNVDKE